MKTLLARRAVLLSLGLILMATFPKSNAQFGLRGGGGGGGSRGGGGGGGGSSFFRPANTGGSFFAPPTGGGSTPAFPRFPFFDLEQGRQALRGLVPIPSPSSSSPSSPSSSPPTTTSSPPPPPPSPTCPPTLAQCNFPDCAAIPGCQQCQATGVAGARICIRCCDGWALRQGGLFCDRCANEVPNCATCGPVAPGIAPPRIICTACCPGFALDLGALAPRSCTPCSGINACTSCTDGTPNVPGVALRCTGCAAGFTLNQGGTTSCN